MQFDGIPEALTESAETIRPMRQMRLFDDSVIKERVRLTRLYLCILLRGRLDTHNTASLSFISFS